MLQQTHEAVIQDQQRGPPFLIRFNQFFNISGIADSEYQHYLQQSINGTEHITMKTSAGEDFAEKSELKATALGRDLSREDAEEPFLARDQFLTNKASRKEIDEGHLPKDTRAKIYRPGGTATPRRTRTAAHVSAAYMDQAELDEMKAEVTRSGVTAAERAAKQAVAAALGLEFTDEPPGEEPQEASMANAGNATCAAGFEATDQWKDMMEQVTKLKKDNTEMREWCKQKDKGDEGRDAKISAVAGEVATLAASEKSHFEQVMTAIAARNTLAPAGRQPYAPNPNGRCRRCKQKGHGYPDCTVTDDAEAARLYAAWEGTTALKPTKTQGIPASDVAAHFLSCCVQLNFPETRSEPGPGKEDNNSSDPAQVHQSGDHDCNSDMPGATRLGKSTHHTKLGSEQATSTIKSTEAMRHTTQQTNEPQSERATQGSNNECTTKHLIKEMESTS